MSRLLWWLLLGLGAWWLLRRLRGGSAGVPPAQQPPPEVRPPHQAQTMVRCVHCGLHLPQADALTDDAQRSYCSAAHRSAGPA